MHGDWGPPGLLAEWLEARGIPYDLHRTYVGAPMPDLAGYGFVASLGSNRNPNDTDEPAVAAELVLLRDAVAQRRPGARPVLRRPGARRRARRARSRPRREPELGWITIETDDPETVPAGPVARVALRPLRRPARRGRGRAHRAPRRRRSATAATSASSSTRRARSRSSPAGPRPTPSGSRALGHATATALIAATEASAPPPRDAAFALFDGFLETASEPAAPAAALREASMGHPPELSDASVSSVRVIYPDLHGVARGKDVPLIEFDRVADHGLAFCAAVMATDLRHTPVLGPRDRLPRPGREARSRDADAAAVGARGRLLHRRRRPGRGGLARAGRSARRGPARGRGLRGAGPHADRRPGARVLPLRADPDARRAAPLRRPPEHGLHGRPAGRPARRRAPDHRVAGRHGHGHVRRQPRVHELAVRDQPAPRARADRGRPRVPAQVARSRTSPRMQRARRHLHGQAVQRPGRLGLPPPRQRRPRRRQRLLRPRRRRRRLRRAAPLHRRRARPRARADGVPEPDDQRLPPDRPRLARPDHTSAGAGTTGRRSCASRAERGRATRVEIRIGDGSANPYLAIAAILFAGLHGLREELPLPDPVIGRRLHAGRRGARGPDLARRGARRAGGRRPPARRDRRRDRRPRSWP